MASIRLQLLARLDELARREGLLAADTGKARIYRDRIGGTVMWLPLSEDRLEFTLIQVRMADDERAMRLHGLLAQCVDKPLEEIPPHRLGLDADVAVEHWPMLERSFMPGYLRAHREVQAAAGHG
ncbi:hypothetical protein [Euzebya tangerina]|uniref:hypothetical protein n=1 Tax=Euzebya tangerina TaxID=591198 RepID=UPI000E313243|nr:hypothetical protein [Euzebya tangerina]